MSLNRYSSPATSVRKSLIICDTFFCGTLRNNFSCHAAKVNTAVGTVVVMVEETAVEVMVAEVTAVQVMVEEVTWRRR
jgi:hypothetical protein